MTIGEAFKRFRREFNLTQSNVAAKLGILQQSYYKYETDKVKPPAEVVVKLARTYDVSADYLLGLRDTPKPNEVGADEVQAAREFRKALEKFVKQGR